MKEKTPLRYYENHQYPWPGQSLSLSWPGLVASELFFV